MTLLINSSERGTYDVRKDVIYKTECKRLKGASPYKDKFKSFIRRNGVNLGKSSRLRDFTDILAESEFKMEVL